MRQFVAQRSCAMAFEDPLLLFCSFYVCLCHTLGTVHQIFQSYSRIQELVSKFPCTKFVIPNFTRTNLPPSPRTLPHTTLLRTPPATPGGINPSPLYTLRPHTTPPITHHAMTPHLKPTEEGPPVLSGPV